MLDIPPILSLTITINTNSCGYSKSSPIKGRYV